MERNIEITFYFPSLLLAEKAAVVLEKMGYTSKISLDQRTKQGNLSDCFFSENKVANGKQEKTSKSIAKFSFQEGGMQFHEEAGEEITPISTREEVANKKLFSAYLQVNIPDRGEDVQRAAQLMFELGGKS